MVYCIGFQSMEKGWLRGRSAGNRVLVRVGWEPSGHGSSAKGATAYENLHDKSHRELDSPFDLSCSVSID